MDGRPLDTGTATAPPCGSDEGVVHLCTVLGGTFSSDQSQRKAAEEHLKMIEATPGLPGSLLTIIRRQEIQLEIRLAASIFLKNEIRRHWQPPLPPFGASENEAVAVAATAKIYSDADKALVRNCLFETLVAVCETTAIRNMVEECLRFVALYDFPTHWPEILDTIYASLNNLGQVPEQHIFCSLLALRRLTGKYELDIRADRAHLDSLVEKTFPLVLRLAEHLTRKDSAGGSDWSRSTGKAMMMKLICAIYWSSTQMALAKGGEVKRTLDHWMALMETIVTSPIPTDVLQAAGADDESRSRLEQLKTKKRALQIVHRFFSRYGTDREEYKAFGKIFIENWSCRFLDCFILLLRNRHSPEWYLTKRMHSLVFQYLSQASEISKTYKFMKKDVPELLSEHCFPLLCYTTEDEEAWEYDPVDFVRSQNDLACAFADPREAAIELIQTIARLRARDFLSNIQQIAESALEVYNTSSRKVALSVEACRKKDGALHMLGSIANRLAAEKRKNPVGKFLTDHVFTEFENPNKFLRLRACWTAEHFLYPSGMNFAFTNRKTVQAPKFDREEDLIVAFQKMLKACGDSELPVRIQAGTSIKAFFVIATEYESGVLRKAISENLAEVVRRLFLLMSDMDNEWVVGTLQTLVEHFEDEVLPYAAQLTEALAAALMRLLGDESGEAKPPGGLFGAGGVGMGDEEGDALTAAMSIAETILSILTSSNCAALKDSAKAYQLTSCVTPVLKLMVHPENPDFLDEGLRMLGIIVGHTPTIDEQLWILFERVHSAVCGGPATPHVDIEIFRNGWAPDYLNQMVPVIHNYLMRDVGTFASRRSTFDGKPYLQLILEMATRGLDDNGDPYGAKHGLELLGCTFEAFLQRPELYDFMKPAFEVIWKYLHQINNKTTRGVMLYVWSTMMLYNTRLFIQMLQEANLVKEVFTQFQDLSVLKTIEAKKVFLLAFGELLTLAVEEPDAVPQIVSQNLEDIARQLAEQQKQTADLRKKLEEEDDSSDGSFETEDSEEDLAEDDDAREKSERILGRLRAAQEKAGESGDELDEEDEDEDDDSYETEGSMEDIKCHSRLDDVYEMIIFGKLLTKHRAIFCKALDPKQLSALDACVAQEVALQTERRSNVLAANGVAT